ncbi:MAG TPA: hypothetical protein VMQ99_06380 [Acetobacteraceae bacterium]|nr:hypothetical protein [Acetobacteraceae bacterium]
MVDTPQGGFPRPSSEMIARLLLESARQDPALLGRSHPAKNQGLGGGGSRLPVSRDFEQPMQLLGNIPHSLRHNDVEVEDLVLIAVESAHQAQDAVREARQVAGMMRRGVAFSAGLGVIGLLAAIAAIADNQLHFRAGATASPPEVASLAAAPAEPTPTDGNHQLRVASGVTGSSSEIASLAAAPGEPTQMGSGATASATASLPLSQQTQPGNDVAAGPLIETPSPPLQGAGVADLLIPSAAAQPTARAIVPPVYHAPPASHSAPWPNGRPVVRSYVSAPTRPVVVPQFFVALRRDFTSLFRGFPPHS